MLGLKFSSSDVLRRVSGSLSIFTFAIVLASCGSDKVGSGANPSAPPNTNPPAETKATLALFGAPHCGSCKESFPKIQALLDAVPADRAKSLYVIMYVTESEPDKPASQEIADSYKEFLHFKGTAVVDQWRWKKFREYIRGALQLPGAAILDANGKVLQSFRAGSTTFIPSEIVKAAEEAAK